MHDKCSKISYTKLSDKVAYANSADRDRTAPLFAISLSNLETTA